VSDGITLVSCISPHQEMRQYAKNLIGCDSFQEPSISVAMVFDYLMANFIK
jgi:adenylylsulfate kinase-like enzyme